jgi:hypothetical protein
MKFPSMAYLGAVLWVGTVNIWRLDAKNDKLLRELDDKYARLGYK